MPVYEKARVRIAAFAVALSLAHLCPSALALDPSLDVSQYAHTVWQVREGFTQGYIRSIAQTPDGYIWLGTGFGLFRFDGVRVEHWQPPLNGEQLPSIFSCASMSPATALSGSAQWEAWRAGEMANSLGTRTLLACLSLRFLKIATERFGSATTRWRRLESSVRSMEQMFTAMDRTAP